MAYCCPKSVRACALRVTRLNSSGVPLDPTTADSRIQTAGFMELSLTPAYEQPGQVVTRDQCGNVMIVDQDFDVLLGLDVSLKVCGVPATVFEMMLESTVTDTAVVLKDSKRFACQDPLMVEVWSKNADATCAPGGATTGGQWIHWVLPRTTRWELDSALTFSSGALELSLRGYATANPGWFPSYAGDTFASYVDGWPVGEAPCVLPTGVTADAWTLTDLANVRDGGPLAWKCVDALPEPLAECDYAPATVVA